MGTRSPNHGALDPIYINSCAPIVRNPCTIGPLLPFNIYRHTAALHLYRRFYTTLAYYSHMGAPHRIFIYMKLNMSLRLFTRIY